MKSQPVYAILQPDPDGRHHVLIGQGRGGAALTRLMTRLPHGTDTRILYTGDAPLGLAGLRCFPTEAELLVELDCMLSNSVMGTRLYVAGSESFLGSVVRVTLQYNLNHDEVQCELCGSTARRVYCIHCKVTNDSVSTNVVKCAGCGRRLLVRDHYSRRLAAYMGVMADAETPGELPPTREVFG